MLVKLKTSFLKIKRNLPIILDRLKKKNVRGVN